MDHSKLKFSDSLAITGLAAGASAVTLAVLVGFVTLIAG